jgi:TetR/AcrR family fatty acid metabolism transcriptional regulator
MPRVSAERLQDRYESILEAASQVFTLTGFEASSIAEIARTANVSEGLIYRYFENKRDLLLQVLRRFFERMLARVEAEVVRQTEFADRLLALTRIHLEAFVDDTAMCRLLIAEGRISGDYPGSQIRALNRRYTSVLLKIVEEGIEQGAVRPDVDARMLRDFLFGGIEHLAWRHVTGSAPLDAALSARTITDLLVRGVQPSR